MPQQDPDILTSLFIQAVRQGQSLWFRVASNSMFPLLRSGDEVYIRPASASQIRYGEIAAFETSRGLVIHRIVAIQQTAESIRLLQMSDVELLPSWVKEQEVVGKVSVIRQNGRKVDLQRPIAKWWGAATASIRYRLYLYDKNRPLRAILRGSSRLAILLSHYCIRSCCASRAADD